MSTKSYGVTNLKLKRQAGTARTVEATWGIKAAAKTIKQYNITWYYLLEGGSKYYTTTATSTVQIASWTAGDNVKKVYVEVTPEAKTHTVTVKKKGKKKKKQKLYWKGTKKKSDVFTDLLKQDPKLTTPPAPTMKEVIENGVSKIAASISGYVEGTGRCNNVKIEIFRYDSWGNYESKKGTDSKEVTLSKGSAVHKINGQKNKIYAARVKAIGIKGKTTDSDWSGYATQIEAQGPDGGGATTVSTPSTPSISINGTTITASVDNYYDAKAKKIQFQFVRDDSRTEVASDQTKDKDSFGRAACTYRGTYDHKYKVRARAISSSSNYGNSPWTSFTANETLSQTAIPAPSTPTVTLSATTLTARIDNYTDTDKANQIVFEIVKNDASSVEKTETQNLVNGYAAITYTVTAGQRYKVRARAKKDTRYSTWSGYSSNVSTTPAVPSTPSVSVSGTTLTFRVDNYTDTKANQIRFQIVKDNSSVVWDNIDKNITTGSAYGTYTMALNASYKVRARAKKDSYLSDWSAYSENTSTTPNTAPTPTVTIDEETLKLEARIDNYNDTRASQIDFEIVSNDSSTVTQRANITTGAAKITYPVSGQIAINTNYKVRAKAVGSDTWSAYSANIKLAAKKPATPGTVNIDIQGRTLTASVDNYNDTTVDKLYFQIIRDNSATVFNQNYASVITGRAALVVLNIPIGSEYKARARAVGARGVSRGLNSDWTNYSEPKRTIPENVPAFTKIAAMSSTSIRLDWAKAKAADSYRIQYTFNHEGYVIDDAFFDTGVDVTTVDDIKALFYPALNLDMGKTYYFRIKAVNETGESEKWSTIASCIIGTTPDAPTTWTYTTTGIIGDPIVMNWTHNTQDSADQTGARVYVRITNSEGEEKSAEQIVATIEGKTQSYSYNTASLSDGDVVNWRISTRGTKGIANEWGAKSTTRTVSVYTRPTLVVEAGGPGEGEIPVVTSFPINILMTAQPNTQEAIAFYVSIIANAQYDVIGEDGVRIHVSAGETIFQKYVEPSSNIETLVLEPGDIYLVEEIQYTIRATVSMSNGLSAEGETSIIAQWDEPKWDPDAEIDIDENTMTAMIRPFCSDENGIEFKTGFKLAVYRIDYNGEFTLIQKDIDASATNTVVDLHPSLDYARYRIVATDLTNGLVSYNDADAPDVGIGSVVIQWGGSWEKFDVDYDTDVEDELADTWSGTFLELPNNIDISDNVSPDVSLVEYIGRKHPVSYYGTQQGATSSWKVDIEKSDVDTLRKIRALSIYPGDVYVREPYGTGYWANVKVSYSISHNESVIPVTFDVTRVEGGA